MEQTQNPSIPSSEKRGKNMKIVKWALVVGIMIVLNLFFNYSISLVYKEKTFDTFCPVEKYNKQYTTKDMCTTDGGMWTESTAPYDMKSPTPVNGQIITGYCNPTYTCGKVYEDYRSVYNRNVFIMLVVLGVLSLVAGSLLANISVVSFGLSFGGVISLIIGSVRYWSNMHDIVRVLVLAGALGALIWIGIKKIRE